jgi:hypothetical protein
VAGCAVESGRAYVWRRGGEQRGMREGERKRVFCWDHMGGLRVWPMRVVILSPGETKGVCGGERGR